MYIHGTWFFLFVCGSFTFYCAVCSLLHVLFSSRGERGLLSSYSDRGLLSSCGGRGSSPAAVRGGSSLAALRGGSSLAAVCRLLIAVASLVDSRSCRLL